MRIALGAGAALCLVVGLPAAAELSNRSTAAGAASADVDPFLAGERRAWRGRREPQ
jgi:hypothetical protein